MCWAFKLVGNFKEGLFLTESDQMKVRYKRRKEGRGEEGL